MDTFDIDFGNSLDTAPDDLYASVDGQIAGLSAEEAVFQVRHNGDVHVMTMDVLRAMDQIHHFRPMEEQISQIEKTNPQLEGKRDAIARVLDGLKQRGLMVTPQQLLGDVAIAGEGDNDDNSDATIIIRTADRPEQLKALLDSLGDRQQKIIVLDDSADDSAEQANAAIAADHTHLGQRWRQALAAELGMNQRSGLLCGRGSEFTGGRVANAALLLSAGSRTIQLDDDMLWNPRVAKGGQPGIRFDPFRQVPTYYAQVEEDLQAALESTDTDWLGRHLAMCGADLGAAAKAAGQPLDFSSLRNQSFKRVARMARGGQVKSTAAGYYGDVAMDTRMWFYTASQPQSLWRGRQEYFDLLARPLTAQAFGHFHVGELTHFTPTAIDNRTLLAPTVPTGRGEDLMAGIFTRYLYPHSVIMHLPMMVEHRRSQPHPAENPDHFTPWASRFFAEYALAHVEECEADSPAHRIAYLAAVYESLAAASSNRRQTLLREFLSYMRSQIVNQLQRALVGHQDAPDYWQRSVTDWIEANGRALTEKRAPVLRGWDPSLSSDGCADQLAADARELAANLSAWPAYWNRCAGERDALLKL